MAKIPAKLPPTLPRPPWGTRVIYAICLILPLGLAIALFMNKGEAGRSVGWDAILLTSTPPMPVPIFLNEIRTSAGLSESLELNDATLLGKLNTACSLHPWVAKVRNVSLVGPEKIQLDLQFRQPVARIRHNGHWFLVDREGFLLPPLQNETEKDLLELLGWESPWPLDEKAKNWLMAGAVLAEIFEKDHARWSIAAIILVRQPVLEPELRLQTQQGQQIVWQSLDNGLLDEPTPEVKLSRLRKYFEQYAAIPRGQMLDTRSKEGILRLKQSP